MKEPFADADQATRAFYSRLFYVVLLNLKAVEMGVYDMLLCESDDPLVGLKWREDIPKVVQALKLRKERGY
jgi:hypothetical protein